jgi:outer membrane protein TolC
LQPKHESPFRAYPAPVSFDLTRKQYQLGAVSYLMLLNTERQYQEARIGLVQTQAARFADTAALFQALGGGWWNRDAPGASPATAQRR